MRKIVLVALLAVLTGIPLNMYAQFVVSAQGAVAVASYNDVSLPGNTGTRLALAQDLDSRPAFSPRIEAGYEFASPFYIGGMASLLRVKAKGTLKEDVDFGGKTFASGSNVQADYRFDSYRVSVRYYFYKTKALKLGAGVTGKIRDANITLSDGTQEAGLSNTGAVPLLNFYARWFATPALSLLFYGDAAWSPYGRAEDFFLGGTYACNNYISIMIGYRMLEGGAVNNEVYTMAMFHYAVLGAEMRY